MRKREKGGKEKDKERVEEGEKKIKRTKEKKKTAMLYIAHYRVKC